MYLTLTIKAGQSLKLALINMSSSDLPPAEMLDSELPMEGVEH
jgi:hypothetical protein